MPVALRHREWCKPAVSSWRVSVDLDYRRDGQWSVEVREHHRGRVARHTDLPAQGCVQQCRIDVQQHQVFASGKNTVSWQVDLVSRREVDESRTVSGLDCAANLGPGPLPRAAQVNQQRRHAHQHVRSADANR